MSEIQGWLTVHEAAALIGVSHSQVTRYVKKKQIASRRIGQTILISDEEAKRFHRPPRGNPKLLEKSA